MFLKEEEYVYRDLEIRMSKERMANVLYAGFETASRFTILWNMNRGEYTMKQNSHNGASIKVHIHPSQIKTFEELAGCKLETPVTIQLN